MKNSYECSFDNYINDKYSICREERQYALYLYNIIRKYKDIDSREQCVQDVFKACELEDAIIEYVFYEFSYMRDCFVRNRQLQLCDQSEYEERILESPNINRFDKGHDRQLVLDREHSFNAKLLCYLLQGCGMDKGTKIEEVNYGHNEYAENIEGQKDLDEIFGSNTSCTKDDRGIEIKKLVQSMMNAKPDLAVVYKGKDGKRYLLFIECKFESYVAKTNGIKQTIVQGYIADFLCNCLMRHEGIETADIMRENGGESLVVKFARKIKKSAEEDHTVLIEDLISINELIFK